MHVILQIKMNNPLEILVTPLSCCCSKDLESQLNMTV